MSAFSNGKQKLPSCFSELIKADVVYDSVKRTNPVDFKALKSAREDQKRWRSACARFISKAKSGE
jgi:hypothetical protein